MATIVNTPAAPAESGTNWGGLMAVILVIAFIMLVFYYGLPALRNAGSTTSTPQINVPGKVDVNVNHTK